jgi:hypothetical protein
MSPQKGTIPSHISFFPLQRYIITAAYCCNSPVNHPRILLNDFAKVTSSKATTTQEGYDAISYHGQFFCERVNQTDKLDAPPVKTGRLITHCI